MRPTLDPAKLAMLKTADGHLTARHGAPGTPSRLEFESKARAWYYGEVLRDARKAAHITQQALAEKIGKKREYISLIERGETDMQLSTFLSISGALGLHFSLTR